MTIVASLSLTGVAVAQRLDGAGIDGSYSGLVVCGARVDRIQLQLSSEDGGRFRGSVQQMPWLNPTGGSMGSVAVPVVGSYGADTGLFQLRSPPGAAPRGSEVALVGGLQADGSGLVAGPPGGNRVSSGSLCGMVVARRGAQMPDEWMALEREAAPGAAGGMAALLLQVPEKLEQGRDLLRRECAAPLMPWLQQLPGLSSLEDLRRGNVSALMMADSAFVPHFGKSFDALTAQERLAFRVQQSGSCARDPRLRELHRLIPNELLRAFHNLRDFPDVAKAAARIPLGELRRWRDGALTQLQVRPPADAQVIDTLLQWGQVLVDPLWLSEGRAFSERVVSARAEGWVRWLTREFESVKPQAMSNLLTLEQVARSANSARQRFPMLREEDVVPLRAAITTFVREQVLDTADAWAGTTTHPAQARLMAEAPTSLPGIAALLDEPRRDALRQRLATHRRDLIVRIVQAERQSWQRQLAALPTGLDGLAELVRHEQRQAREPTGLEREDGFAELADERAQARRERLARLAPELEAMVRRAPHGRELMRLRSTYVLPQDMASPAGARVEAALAERAGVVAPFRDLPAGAYFDALFADDIEAVKDFDAATAARYRSHWEQTKPIFQILDVLASAGTGQRRVQPVVSERVQRAYDRASLITPIMALYLGRYGFERRFQPCVEADALRPRIRYTTIETKRRWGFESSTVASDETVEFVINRRFAAVADDLGVGLKQSEGLVGLERLFFSPDAAPTTDDALRGVRALMSGFDCSDERIRRLEDRMVRHYLRR